MAYCKQLLALCAAALFGLTLLSGCTGAGLATSEFTPTHRWARPDTSVAEYNLHNVRCVRESDVDITGVEAGSKEFLAYRGCMEERGFELMGIAGSRSG